LIIDRHHHEWYYLPSVLQTTDKDLGKEKEMTKLPNVVFLCGGHGSQILHPWGGHVNVTVITPTADSGGSSGELVRQYGVIPPGDMRSALLSGIPSSRRRPIKRMFESRYKNGCMNGHALGNLIFVDCLRRIPDVNRALDELARVFGTHSNWHVRPATMLPITLHTTLSDGGVTHSEGELDQRKGFAHIISASIEPKGIDGNPEAVDAILDADLIVLGPTDHVTSLLAILLVRDIAHALTHAKGKVVYVANLMTKPNETYGYTITDFLRDIEFYAGNIVDHVVVNTGNIPDDLRLKYKAEGQHMVLPDGQLDLRDDITVWKADLLMRMNETSSDARYVRHDPYRTLEVLVQIEPKFKRHIYGNGD
jgi:uncharacterized cofD-like protein